MQTPDPRAGMLGWLLEALWGLLEALGLVASSLEEEQGNRWGWDVTGWDTPGEKTSRESQNAAQKTISSVVKVSKYYF